MKLTPSSLLNIHAQIQKGTYFSKIVSFENEVKYAYSNLITDFYWNYAYNIRSTKKNISNDLAEIKSFAKSINRECALYLTPDSRPKNIISLIKPLEIEDEVWMTFLKTKKNKFDITYSLEIEILMNKQPNEDFLAVFDNAYGGGSLDSSGYFGLPSQYKDSVKNSTPVEGVNIVHFIGRKNGHPVSISTICMSGEFAGLYNVGTTFSERGNKYGSEISKIAMKFALENQCRVIFLQTKANSEVEEMYKKIGFKRKFIGSFVKI